MSVFNENTEGKKNTRLGRCTRRAKTRGHGSLWIFVFYKRSFVLLQVYPWTGDYKLSLEKGTRKLFNKQLRVQRIIPISLTTPSNYRSRYLRNLLGSFWMEVHTRSLQRSLRKTVRRKTTSYVNRPWKRNNRRTVRRVFHMLTRHVNYPEDARRRRACWWLDPLFFSQRMNRSPRITKQLRNESRDVSDYSVEELSSILTIPGRRTNDPCARCSSSSIILGLDATKEANEGG